MPLTIEKLENIAATSEFDLLLGEVENNYFDCKSQPYQLNQSDTAKRELAKDVSSFANAGGGFIFIGIKTKPSATQFGDEVEEIRPFEPILVDPDQYHKIVQSWIYPQLEGLNIKWLCVNGNKDKGILVIKIPPQKDSLKPFLITKTLDANKQVEIVFGYAQRKRDTSPCLSFVDLQRAICSGFNYENRLIDRLDNLEAMLKPLVNNSQSSNQQEDIANAVEQRVEWALEHKKMKEKRAIVLTAYPTRVCELKTIFNSTDTSIRRKLERPPVLRYGGWSLETLDQSKIMRGESIRVANGDCKVIDLYRDATLIFGGLADENFLAHAGQDQPKIHSMAIVELVYSFVYFYKLVLEDCKEMPDGFSIRIVLRNMHLSGIKTFLMPYTSNNAAQLLGVLGNKMEAPDDAWKKVILFKTENYNPAFIAFEVLREIYLWFGLEQEKIPYVKNEEGVWMVNADEIAKA